MNPTTTQTVINKDSLGSQVSFQYFFYLPEIGLIFYIFQITTTLGLPNGTFLVPSATIQPSTRRKRQSRLVDFTSPQIFSIFLTIILFRAQLSCHNSPKLNVLMHMDTFPKTVCLTARCHQNFVDTIITKILQKFGSTSSTFLMELSVGQLVSIPAQICSANEIAARKCHSVS